MILTFAQRRSVFALYFSVYVGIPFAIALWISSISFVIREHIFQKTKIHWYIIIAYSYVKNEHDALDIIGEATYKGLNTLRTLREPDYFDTWMTRIVINTAIDFIRKHSRVALCEDTAPEVMAVPEKELTPEDSMDLYQALDALSEKDRACVMLRYFEDQSFIQIAKILQEPEATVKSRLYRALRKMRGFLEEGAYAR